MRLDTALIVKPRMVAIRPVLFPYRVHCTRNLCRWSCPVSDADDAEDVLAAHLTAEHEGKVLCES